MHYGVEIIFKQVTKGLPGQDQLLDQYGYNDSYAGAFSFLIGFAVFMLLFGWFLLWVTNRNY